MKKDNFTDQAHKTGSTDDLIDRGIHDIIPDDEEYYTLNLKRSFDDTDNEIDTDIFDVSNVDPHNLDAIVEPPRSSSIYEDGVLVSPSRDGNLRSHFQKEEVYYNNIVDENNHNGYNVGDPGNLGIDEGTE